MTECVNTLTFFKGYLNVHKEFQAYNIVIVFDKYNEFV